jgi:hypothetical protein
MFLANGRCVHRRRPLNYKLSMTALRSHLLHYIGYGFKNIFLLLSKVGESYVCMYILPLLSITRAEEGQMHVP